MSDDASPSALVSEAAPAAAPPPKPPVPTLPHALFAVGTMRFGLPIASVGEVVSDMILTRLPHASKGLLGLVNLRGEILPAATLEPWFGDSAAPATSNLFLVVRATACSIALRIDRFEQVAAVPEDAIHPDDAAGPPSAVAPTLWRREAPAGNVHCLSADGLFESLRLKKAQLEESPAA